MHTQKVFFFRISLLFLRRSPYPLLFSPLVLLIMFSLNACIYVYVCVYYVYIGVCFKFEKKMYPFVSFFHLFSYS